MWLSATRQRAAGLCVCAAILAARCGATSSPTTPSDRKIVTTAATGPSVAAVTVGVAGNAAPVVTPGATLQLWAVATFADGTSGDVTNTAQWKSSNPAVATISRDGLVTTSTEGSADIAAAVGALAGSVHLDIRRAACDSAGLSPAVLIYNAFGSYAELKVTTPSTDCRWTAKSDVSWLHFSNGNTTFDPGRSGSGSFFYEVAANNFPNARSGHIIVSIRDGAQLVHSVSQEAPVSCSYVATPMDAKFTAAGGTGSFQLVVTPPTCQWTATAFDSYAGIRLTSSAAGTGSQRVTYTVGANFSGFAREGVIQIAGLSGVHPPAIHKVHIGAQ